MPVTTATYTKLGTITVNAKGIVVDIPLAQFAALDGELEAVAARAQANPGVPVPVPSTSFAKGLRPKHSRVHGIAQ